MMLSCESKKGEPPSAKHRIRSANQSRLDPMTICLGSEESQRPGVIVHQSPSLLHLCCCFPLSYPARIPLCFQLLFHFHRTVIFSRQSNPWLGRIGYKTTSRNTPLPPNLPQSLTNFLITMGDKQISETEVSEHNSPDKGIYIIVDENVYDVTG